VVALADPAARAEFIGRAGERWRGEVLVGEEAVVELAAIEADVVVNGIVGAAGLLPSLAALRAGRTLALANKESLVIAGELLHRAAAETGGKILPIDSEHSGLFQCLEGHGSDAVGRVVLTASGGPFRAWPIERLEAARPDQALRHPTWNMGPRITVDSATLLNKGFEIHEAHWLFELPGEKIDVWIHPQSVVHALVEWTDGSLLAQLSIPDMRLPIQYALLHPERADLGLARCSLPELGRLEFEEVDPRRYPCLDLARRALAMGGTAPAILNAADEVLVHAFLEGRIRFPEIALHLDRILDTLESEPIVDVSVARRADRIARERAMSLVGLA
jgi:1-deoxy-D-xylulose-5-phosphate reductoisomerase